MNELKQRVLSDVKMFVLDMDGTFYLGDQLIEGSLEFIDKVKETGRDFIFLPTMRPRIGSFYKTKLAKMGMDSKMLPFLQQETLPLSI
ncbi:MAG: hypothetical protein ACLRMN_00110 [Mediterraneibacter gnavus]